MPLIQIFQGPVPAPPRSYVEGVDRPRASDVPVMQRVSTDYRFLIALTCLPNTPFTGKFQSRAE